MRRLRLGLYLLFLLMLSGCFGSQLTQAETVLVFPPSPLMQDCPETVSESEVVNNGDLLELAKMLRLDLAECNKSKERLREWAAGAKNATGAEK